MIGNVVGQSESWDLGQTTRRSCWVGQHVGLGDLDEMDSRVACRCSSFVLFFKIVKPFAAGAELCPMFLSRCRFCTLQSSFSLGKTRRSSLDQFNFQVIWASVQHDLVSFGEERERERVCVCVCLCVHALFFLWKNFFCFSVGIAKAETHLGSGIAGLVKLSSLFASFLVVGTETMKWRRFLIREYHTMRVLFQCSEQFAKDGNCVERALETDTHGHVQQGRKEYRA